jgi:hypothetical protein
MVRLVTMFCVLAVCGFAMARGWQVASFAAAEPALRRAEAGSEAFLAWRDVPGVSAAALTDAMLASLGRAADPGARAERLSEILAARPLSSIDWLALAGTRVAMKAPWERVIAALTMSYVTGPNEAPAMLQRGLFGVIEWDYLPAATRAETIRDLAGTIEGSAMANMARSLIKRAIATRTPDAKAEIAAMLKSQQIPAADLAQVGL